MPCSERIATSRPGASSNFTVSPPSGRNTNFSRRELELSRKQSVTFKTGSSSSLAVKRPVTPTAKRLPPKSSSYSSAFSKPTGMQYSTPPSVQSNESVLSPTRKAAFSEPLVYQSSMQPRMAGSRPARFSSSRYVWARAGRTLSGIGEGADGAAGGNSALRTRAYQGCLTGTGGSGTASPKRRCAAVKARRASAEGSAGRGAGARATAFRNSLTAV